MEIKGEVNNLAIEQYNNRKPRGFTLIELLIVIAILGILSVGVLVAINVTGNLNKANLAKAKTFAASVENDLAISQVGKWSFEEGSGSTAKDTSGYGNDGTLSSASMWKLATDPTCKDLGFGGCLNFNGDSDYVEVVNPTSFNFGTANFSIVAWVKRDVTASEHDIITKSLSGSWASLGKQFIILSNKLMFDAFAVGNVAGNTFLSTNTWYHVVVTYIASGNKVKLYVNGQQDGSGTLGLAADDASHVIRIGQKGNTSYFKGFIDEVQIYSEALTAYQMRELYAQGLPRHQLARK